MAETQEQITKQELDALKMGSAMLYAALNRVYLMHELEVYKDEEGNETEICAHCSDLAGEGRGIYYPCPTVDLLLEYFVAVPENPEQEETPAE